MTFNEPADYNQFGHKHETEHEAVIIPIPVNRVDTSEDSTEVNDDNRNWHTPLAYGVFAGLLGGIIAMPAIEMIESEHGFAVDIPGSINSGSLVFAGTMFVATAIYKHFKG